MITWLQQQQRRPLQMLKKLNPFSGAGSKTPRTGRRMSLQTDLIVPQEPVKIFTLQELNNPLFIKKTNTCKRRATCSDLERLAALSSMHPSTPSFENLVPPRTRKKKPEQKENSDDKNLMRKIAKSSSAAKRGADLVSIEETEEEIVSRETQEGGVIKTIETDIDQSGDNIDDIRGQVNTAFKFDKFDNTSGNDYFVNSFGKKGKDVGEFQDAKDIAVALNGRIIVTDLINNRIQVCNSSGRSTMTFSGMELLEPWSVSVTDAGDVVVTSCRNKSVVTLNEAGDVIKNFGSDVFQCPTGVATDKSGRFIVCDSMTDKVSIHNADGIFVRYIGNPGFKEQIFSKPRYVCCSATGEIIVSDSGNHKIKVFDTNGDYIRSIGQFGKLGKQFKTPYGVCCNSFGDIFVADHYNNRISMFTQNGVFIRHVVASEHGLLHPQGIALSDDHHLYVTHGHLKATEIAIFKLSCSVEGGKSSDKTISHV